MAGPYCKTCRHYYPMALTDHGECGDSAKRIYAGGNPVNQPPEVWPRFECSEHKPADQKQ